MSFRFSFCILFFVFLFVGFTNAIAIKDLTAKASELYLINPLDSNEQVTVNSNSKIICNGTYWVLSVSNADDYVIINDATPNNLVDNDKAKDLIQTMIFFSKLTDVGYNSSAENYFDSFYREMDDYQYKLNLVKQSIDSEEVSHQIEIIVSDVNDLQKSLVIAKKDISTLEETIYKESYTCNGKDDIIQQSDTFEQQMSDIDSKVTELKKNVGWLKGKLSNYADLNISLDNAVSLSDMLTLPPTFLSFPQEESDLSNSKTLIDKISYKDNDFDIELIVDEWKTRKDRASFLSLYLGKDAEVNKRTGKDTPKELFDYIIANASHWQDSADYTIFNKNYNDLLAMLKSQDFANAKSKLILLKTTAYKIKDTGFAVTASDSTDDSTDWFSQYSIYIYAGIAIILVLVLPKLVKAVVNMVKPKEDDNGKEPEVNVDLPSN